MCVHFSEGGRNCGSLCRSNMTLLMVFFNSEKYLLRNLMHPSFPGIFSSKKEKKSKTIFLLSDRKTEREDEALLFGGIIVNILPKLTSFQILGM